MSIRKYPSLFLIVFCSTTCLTQENAPNTGESPKKVSSPQIGLKCSTPYTNRLATPFTMTCQLLPDSPKPQTVHIYSPQIIEFQPRTLALRPGENRSVTVTVKKAPTGLADILVDSKDFSTESLIDVGFKGQLKVSDSNPLQYYQPRAMQLSLVDTDGKPLNIGLDQLLIEVQIGDGEIAPGNAYNQFESCKPQVPNVTWSGGPTVLPLCPGAAMSPPFQLRSTTLLGGTTYVVARLHLADGQVLTEASFMFKTEPPPWLPAVFAIIGASLYSIYRLIESESVTTLKGWLKALTLSAIVGCVAWAFAKLDILGIKLDTATLRTYLILGFAFSFIGIDRILKKFLPPEPAVTKNDVPN